MKATITTLWFLFNVSPCFSHPPQEILQAESPPSKAFLACQSLSSTFPNLTAFPGSPSYTSQSQHYWSQTAASLHPPCRVSPSTASEVSSILQIIREFGCKFAVKSGGHSTNVNVSNFNEGVVIDLWRLDGVSVERGEGKVDGQRRVKVGAGARWRDVYGVLDREGLGVGGARAGSVGVGGYLLGGGISVFSGEHGWACDGVEEFEVILANSSITNASLSRNPDLFLALKGGGNTFGLITSFTLSTFPLPPLQTASIAYDWYHTEEVLETLVSYNFFAHDDPSAAVTVSLTYDVERKAFSSVASLISSSHTLRNQSLLPFFHIPYTRCTEEVMTPLEFAGLLDQNNPPGFRQYRSTLTVINGDRILKVISELFKNTFTSNPLFNHDPGFRPGLLLQPLTLPHLQGRENSLGLENEKVPLMIITLEVRHTFPYLDDTSIELITNFIEICEIQARNLGVWHSFKYMNYASSKQDVFQVLRENGNGNGNVNIEWLRKVRERYDTDGFWESRLGSVFTL